MLELQLPPWPSAATPTNPPRSPMDGLPSRFTTATATIPAPGVVRSCTAATACAHTVLGATADEARLMLADHEWATHRAGRTGAQR
jgi:hypothetical protein